MAKFKVGDRVRDIESSDNAKAKVVCVPSDHSITVEWEGFGDLRGTWPADKFELIQPSPIRTVTRREIVPGEYGCVEIMSVGYGYVSIRAGGVQDANALREAARIFSEIADVLETEVG